MAKTTIIRKPYSSVIFEDFFTLRQKDLELCARVTEVLTLWMHKDTKDYMFSVERNGCCNKEVYILMEMMCRHLDKYHIVKFYGWIAPEERPDPKVKTLLFELLIFDLRRYLKDLNNNPMPLSDIRDIIQQMAKALEALKRIGIIHGNITLLNISMVDHEEKPLRVKLRGFKFAMLRSKVKARSGMEYSCYGSPEMILDLPFSEATDIWSLGIVMLYLICGSEFEIPNDQDMSSRKNLKDLFTHGWRINSLDDLQTMHLESDNTPEAVEREQCIGLVKAMLEIDPNKRISPSEVLTHPFIDCTPYPWKSEYLENSATEKYSDILDFEIMDRLGQGSYGEMRKCRNNNTGEIVAVKRPKIKYGCDNEIAKLKVFTYQNHGHPIIVRLCGWLDFSIGKAAVFEILDMSLHDFSNEYYDTGMSLSQIRVIIKQIATALEALRIKGIIHADLKLDNIMVVDHKKKPLEVKLIDFGLAMYRYEAKQGVIRQVVMARAPELLLGLPFSEAIDMWSLGFILAYMICGRHLFMSSSREETVRKLVKLLGQPADHLLNDGIRANEFFTKTESNHWKFKNPGNKIKKNFPRLPDGRRLKSLDDLKTIHLESDNKAEAVEREQCIELLKAMLEMDQNKRITPSEVLTHPFIDFLKDSDSTTLMKSAVTMVNPLPQERGRSYQVTETQITMRCHAESCNTTLKKTSEVVPECIRNVSIHEGSTIDESNGKTMEKRKKKKKKKNIFKRLYSRVKNLKQAL